MAILLGFAFLSGLVTILSPCILPLLPLILSGGVGGGKARPLGIIAGFILSFSFFTLALSAIVELLGLPADSLRWLAVALIAGFGLSMLFPRLQALFEGWTSGLAALGSRRRGPGAGQAGAGRAEGFGSGLLVGLGLGLVWTPCVGPIMASVISLAVTARVDGGAVALTLAYAAGTAIPMLAVMAGGRGLLRRLPGLSRNAGRIQRVFGLLMILVALSIGLGWDRAFQAALLRAFPGYGAGLAAVEDIAPVRAALAEREAAGRPGAGGPEGEAGGPAEDPYGGAIEGPLGDYGPAPDIAAPGPWLGTPPLDLAALRGKVLLLDFWTYSCVNCIRTLPWLRAWKEAYEGAGLIVLGVHSPEFAFERDRGNVERAMRDLEVTWPVVMDNDFGLWSAWRNRYWPAHYLVDARGRLRHWRFGEGGYAETEAAIRALLAEAAGAAGSLSAAAALPPLQSPEEAPNFSRTPETYLGYARGRGFASAVPPRADGPEEYRPARSPGNGEWNLHGEWTIAAEYSAPGPGGALELGFEAREVFLALEPDPAAPGARIRVLVDGAVPPDTEDLRGGYLSPDSSRLYKLVGLPEAGAHVLRLEPEGGHRLFAFTFG